MSNRRGATSGTARAAATGAHSPANLRKNAERSLEILELFKRMGRMAEEGRGLERIGEDWRGWKRMERMERSEGLGVEKEY